LARSDNSDWLSQGVIWFKAAKRAVPTMIMPPLANWYTSYAFTNIVNMISVTAAGRPDRAVMTWRKDGAFITGMAYPMILTANGPSMFADARL
jgi:hypothetical protein